MNARLTNRLIAAGLIDAIDRLDPCSRQRQPSALSHLQGRVYARRLNRTLANVSLAALAVIAALVAFH